MKKMNSILAAALLLFNFTFLPTTLTKEERERATEYMKSTRNDLMNSIKGLSKEQLNFKPSADAWSIAECVEHIALSETNLMGLVTTSLKEEANPARRSEVKNADNAVYTMISDRTNKVKTFEAYVPTGKFGSHENTLREFLMKRDETIRYINSTQDDMRNHYFKFPVEAIGVLDSFQLLVFIAGHTKRHTLQIEEVKQHPLFPKK